jgi:nucleoside-diphosphate-sugar epimerase
VFRRLVEAGLSVCGTDIKPWDDAPEGFVTADLLDLQAVRPLVDGRDAVVHLGNHNNAREDMPANQTYLENVTMNTHVFHAAEQADVGCVVFASSIQVVSGNRRSDEPDGQSCLSYLPLDGQTPPCPGNTYALSKQAGEDALRYQAYLHPDRSYTSLRFPWLTGERIEGQAQRRQPIHPGPQSLADEAFAYLTLSDAADLILCVLNQHPAGYQQYLPSAGNYLGLTPAELVGRYYPGVPLRAPIQTLSRLVDITSLQADLGWQPRDRDLFSPGPA